MHPCSRCRRHVLVSTTQCPFCGAAQRDIATHLGGFAGVLLGLALVGCGDDSETATNAESTMTAPTETDGTTDPGTSVGVTDSESAEVSDYGGPGSGVDTSTTESTTASSTDASSSTDAASSTDGESSSGSSGTDTGSSTSDTGSAEGADYGAAPPRE
jgi:hypothetical protein